MIADRSDMEESMSGSSRPGKAYYVANGLYDSVHIWPGRRMDDDEADEEIYKSVGFPRVLGVGRDTGEEDSASWLKLGAGETLEYKVRSASRKIQEWLSTVDDETRERYNKGKSYVVLTDLEDRSTFIVALINCELVSTSVSSVLSSVDGGLASTNMGRFEAGSDLDKTLDALTDRRLTNDGLTEIKPMWKIAWLVMLPGSDKSTLADAVLSWSKPGYGNSPNDVAWAVVAASSAVPFGYSVRDSVMAGLALLDLLKMGLDPLEAVRTIGFATHLSNLEKTISRHGWNLRALKRESPIDNVVKRITVDSMLATRWLMKSRPDVVGKVEYYGELFVLFSSVAAGVGKATRALVRALENGSEFPSGRTASKLCRAANKFMLVRFEDEDYYYDVEG